MIKKIFVILLITISIFIIFTIIENPGSEEQIDDEIIKVDKNQESDEPRKIPTEIVSEFFNVWVYETDIFIENGVKVAKSFHFELIEENNSLYKEIGIINDDVNVVVILPVFTSSAYSKNGFYDYFENKCDSCTTTQIVENDFLEYYTASQIGAKILEKLGYETITDIVVDKNPDILKEFDSIILLHNEYVTQTMFDTITKHPNVIYLYPNALYAEIDVNYEKNQITLIKGHEYPSPEIKNGFNWEYDNTHPYEFDRDCLNWEFYDIPNGKMLNCYPEKIFPLNKEFLKEIKNLVN
jgi:hypothetical protein